MPKCAIKYQNVVIYGLRRKSEPSVCLYDYTTRPASRKCMLKKGGGSDDSSEFVREAGGWEAVDFFLVKRFPCACALDALFEVNRLMYE
jgi:hypothetical protein